MLSIDSAVVVSPAGQDRLGEVKRAVRGVGSGRTNGQYDQRKGSRERMRNK
jgi:hypothetical protein